MSNKWNFGVFQEGQQHFKKYEAVPLLFLLKSHKKKRVLYKCLDLIIYVPWGNVCIKAAWERNSIRENFLYTFSNKGESLIYPSKGKAEAQFPNQRFHQKAPHSCSHMLELLLSRTLCLQPKPSGHSQLRAALVDSSMEIPI